jgi:hypothetical protein
MSIKDTPYKVTQTGVLFLYGDWVTAEELDNLDHNVWLRHDGQKLTVKETLIIQDFTINFISSQYIEFVWDYTSLN